MKILALIFFLLFSCVPQLARAQEPGIPALMQITQAGGSLVLDLDKSRYTVTQLVSLAASLKYQATLTIKLGSKPLTAVQCAQIAKARPGQVVFWF